MSAADRVLAAWRDAGLKGEGAAWYHLAEVAVRAVRAEPGEDRPQEVVAGSLAGVRELAAALMVGRTTVTQWAARRHRNGFPSPVAELGMGPIYDLNEVIAWYGQYEPEKGGRPGRMPEKGSP